MLNQSLTRLIITARKIHQAVRELFTRLSRRDAEGADDPPIRFMVDGSETFWTPLGLDGRTGTVVRGAWHVRNLSRQNLMFLKVRLGRLQAEWARVSTPNLHGVARGKHPIRPGGTAKVVADLAFGMPVHKSDEDLVVDVIFTDSCGREHRVPSVRFRAQICAKGVSKPRRSAQRL